MSYRNAIADIPVGSLWEAGEQFARVAGAAATVVTVTIAGRTETYTEAEFRERFQPLYDRAAVRQQFTMSVANLGEFRVFWLPAERRIVCRSVACSRQFRVPEGARLVGAYAAPCSVTTFFEDLDELITRPTHAAEDATDHRARG